MLTACSTYMLHVHFPGHGDAPKKRFKSGSVIPPRVILDSPTTPPPVKKKPSLLLHNKRDLRPSKPQDEKPSVAVAVPTHNRIGYVQLTSKALRGTVPANDVWVFDDQSDEYKHKDLASWYGTEHIFISKRRLKADAMARHILEWFVSSQYDVLVLLDSDLLVAPNWLDSLHAGLRDSKGLLSLYRSGAPKHKSLRCGGVLCEQPSMGNAGTVWRRSIAEKMLSEMSNREGGFDWGWSEWCTKNRVPMQALKSSAVLHIGMHGSWSHETTAEKSVGFPMNELTEDIRKKAEHFLKGAKPLGQIETWQSFENVWLPRYYQMAYANPEARTPNDLEKVKQTCIKLGCVAVSVEQNGWLAYFRNIPLDQTKWLPKRHATMWVMSKYLVPTTKQPDMKYGCSRHAHACRRDPEPGSAPCCAHVMLEIMSDMSRVLRKHNIHWRLTQGQQLSVARDGFVQLWDHDFDPNFDQPEKAKAVIEQEMHLAGKASKYREADYYYTKRVAERLNTDWSKYKVMGGDFNWNVKEFHDPHVLQRNPTFMDIGQNHDAKPTAETTFPCLPGHDILCSKRWFEEVVAEFHSGYQRPSSGMPQEQIPYSGYVAGMNNLMFDENGHERDAQSRADTIRKYISDCPNFWERPCLTSTKPPKSDILWVIPAFKRAWSLDLVLKSLPGQKILVSKDADSAEIDSVLKKYTADVISHPWSCSRHPNQFPAKDDTLNEDYKGDTYGNPRSPWATCLKHHWWWMMKQAWARKPERVCVLEDDTVIHPQAFEWLARQSGNVKLTPEEIAVPWCMSAKEWQAIDPKAFCEHDDYNWDQTIAWMKEHGHGPNEASVPSVSLSQHVGDCGGWDAGGRDKACTPQKITKIRANVEHWLGKPVAVNTIKKKWLTAHTKPNGGWGHPKDWAHCLQSRQKHIIIPSVDRKSDTLSLTIKSALREFPDAKIHVFKNSDKHLIFDKMRKNNRFSNVFWYSLSDMLGQVHIRKSKHVFQIGFDKPVADFSKMQRKQTLDLSIMLQTLKLDEDAIFTILEDDFVSCPEANKYVDKMIDKMERIDMNWVALKTSFGGNGMFFRTRDMKRLGEYLMLQRNFRPFDHLLMEWYHNETPQSQNSDRFSAVGKHNLFEHIGGQLSTVGHNTMASFPKCLEQITYIFGNWQKFDMKTCGKYMISPCSKQKRAPKGEDRERILVQKEYPVIVWPEIRFTSDEQKRLFGQSSHEKRFLQEISQPTPLEQRQGEVIIIADGTFDKSLDCGIHSKTSDWKENRVVTRHYEKLLPLIIPDGWSFQHFTDGTLPKLVAVLPWIHKYDIPILLERPRDDIIHEMLSRLNVKNIVWYESGHVYGAKEMYFACHCPPLHPELWQLMRKNLVGDLANTIQNKIVLIKRTHDNSRNGGRFVNNYDSVLRHLKSKYKNNVIEYDSKDHTIESTIGVFSQAKWVIGSHGGAMFNQLFSKPGTNVVEYMPVRRDGSLFLRHSGMMSYVFSSMLGQVHWRISCISSTGNVDMLLDLPTEMRADIPKYVVVIPSVKRNNDEYLIKTLDSLERARPTDVPVLLVNANQPATKHTYLREWCSSHEKYKCINPPKVPESLIRDVISNDKRGDTLQYLRWRTMEAIHAMFGMTEFLKTGAEYMVWLQDDVTVDEDLFSSLPDEEIVCLRSDGYCGMVAYMFKKSFVQKLIPRLERDYKDMPIDWIVDKTRGKDVVRIPKAYHHGIKSSNGKIRHKTKNEQIITSKQVATIPTLDKSMQNVIKTSDLFSAIDYNADENSGPWKQGWDYDYDGRFKDGLTVHVVPHSHNDPGWIKTYHTYYSTQTRHILDTVVAALTEDPRRTFIWAEISYFSLWWDDASQQQKEQAKKLVAEKRLDFVTGGWVMNDEASVTARATRWHLQEGREWLQKTFGVTPQYSWAIDPFGHSAGQAQVLKELGYKGMLIQRVHYAVKKQLAQKQQLEFQWQTPAGEIFTHMMPFYSYDGPHTCGPDPSVCCQFDFARIGKGKTWTGCPWGKMAVPITDANVAERSRTWLDQVYKKAMLYRGKHVFVPLGDDFRYQSMVEAHKQFANYQKMFDWIKVNVPSVKVSFSTLSRYFDAQRQTVVPSLQGSFFPYSDREKDYWTGYFNSRIFYKGYDRLLESLIAAVERKCPSESIHSEKRALGLFQHHDGITGTAKSAVVQDYYKTMQKAVESLRSKLKGCLSITESVLMNPLSIDTPTMRADEIRPLGEDVCVNKRIDFEKVRFDEHGILIEIDHTPVHETLVWRSNTAGPGVAGAYLMSVTSARDVLVSTSHSTCSTKYYKQMETVFDLVTRRVRVYNDGTLEIMFSVDIHARNNGELWAVYKPEWSAERLCSDVHGLTWECHKEREDAPLQAKFWPMPTMAWLASSSERLTFTGAQPTGVGFHEGAMVLMLDRRGDQDDARGLGQGITDSRPVEMRFVVVMETEDVKEQASKEALSRRNWMLNPEIKLV